MIYGMGRHRLPTNLGVRNSGQVPEKCKRSSQTLYPDTLFNLLKIYLFIENNRSTIPETYQQQGLQEDAKGCLHLLLNTTPSFSYPPPLSSTYRESALSVQYTTQILQAGSFNWKKLNYLNLWRLGIPRTSWASVYDVILGAGGGKECHS